MAAAEKHGGARHGTAVDLVRDKNGRSRRRLEDGEIVDGDAVVIAMGPWSILATRMPLPAVYGCKATA